MATDLHDRLADLAAYTSSASPPADLWARGVRRHRTTQVGRAVLVAVLVALIGVGGWTWQSARPVEPSDTHGSPQLPDTFYYDVSPWTHAFDGPPGPLVTVLPAQQKSLLRTTSGLIGVTGSSGTYGFLDLPADAALDANLDAAFALSPNGRRLAFWLTGTPSGSPNTVQLNGLTLTGVATYDTVTGRVQEHRFETVHGISPSLLLWSDDSTLLVGYSQMLSGDDSEDSGAAHYAGARVWDVASARLTKIPADALPAFAGNWSSRATRGIVVSPESRARSWSILDPDRMSSRSFRTDRAANLVVPSPDHTRVVAVPGDTMGAPLLVADIPPTGAGPRAEAHFHVVPAGRTWFRPLAWVDRNHVAALAREIAHYADGSPYVAGGVELVDIRTGAIRPLVTGYGANGTNSSDPWVANDYFGAPVVHASPPPSPPNLRAWTIGLLVAAGIALLIGIPMLWGSRGRRA
jgi:hypothetical protein